jgi:hypothetical protein
MVSIAAKLRLNQHLLSSKTEIASRISSVKLKLVIANRKNLKL